MTDASTAGDDPLSITSPPYARGALTKAAAPSSGGEVGIHKGPQSMVGSPPHHVVVAHSDGPMRHLLVATLSVVGFAVESCFDRSALERHAGEADAIVVDGRLDGLRPDAVAKLCADLAPAAPVVLVCGASEDVSRMHTPESPTLHVLTAPFGPLDLVGHVARLTTSPQTA